MNIFIHYYFFKCIYLCDYFKLIRNVSKCGNTVYFDIGVTEVHVNY